MRGKSIQEIGKLLRTRALTVEAMVENAIAARRPEWSAYRTFEADRARAQARAADAALRAGRDFGPLHGIPISLKDLYGLPGFDTFAGTDRRLPEAWDHAGPVVRALTDQFGVFIGKTHTVAFAFSGIGMNTHWGTPRNPWDLATHRVPGGSSAGAGVSLVEGSALVAVGTDTAGSVRIPASMTGQVGLKTTKGRWSTEGIVPLSTTLDTPGVLTRTVEDVRWVFEAIDGRPVPRTPELSRLTIGVTERPFFEGCDPGIVEAVHDALDSVARAGARVRTFSFPEAEEGLEIFLRGSFAAIELFAFLKQSLPDWLETLDPLVKHRIATAPEDRAWSYATRLAQMERAVRAARERLGEVDVVATPTVALSPPAVDDLAAPEAYRRANLLALRNTSIVNCLGACALSLPVGKDTAGLPVGLQLIARSGDDARLVAVARALEHELGSGAVRLGEPPADA